MNNFKYKILIKLIICFAYLTFALKAEVVCDFPNVQGCEIVDESASLTLSAEVNSVSKGSNLVVGDVLITANNQYLTISEDSNFSVQQIIPQSAESILDIILDSSDFTIRNQSSLVIDNFIFEENITDRFPIFTLQGFSKVVIENLETTQDALSIVKIQNFTSRLVVQKGYLSELHLNSGVFNVETEGGVKVDNITYIKEEIEEIEESEENYYRVDYEDFDMGGLVRVYDQGILEVDEIRTSRVLVLEGYFKINDYFEIDTLANSSIPRPEDADVVEEDELQEGDTVVEIPTFSKGTVTEVDLQNLDLSGEITVQSFGYINNLNYRKNEDGEFVGDPKGTLIYKGVEKPVEELTEEEIEAGYPENEPEKTELNLTNVFLNTLQLQGGVIRIYSGESIINNIYNFNKKGKLELEYVDSMKSDYVQLEDLSLEFSNYTISGDFDVNHLDLVSNSSLFFENNKNLTFSTLEIIGNSSIEVQEGANLNIDVTDKLVIDSSLLEVNNFNFSGNQEQTGEMILDIDSNIYNEEELVLETSLYSHSDINLENVNLVAQLQNTAYFNLNLSRRYNVMHTETGKINFDEYTLENLETNLPEWFDSDFLLENTPSGGETLVVDIQRVKTYDQLLEMSDYIEDETLRNIAESLDKMVNDSTFNDNLADIITQVDLRSDLSNIAQNLSTLKPIDSKVFIDNMHLSSTSYLDMILQNYLSTSTRNDKPVSHLWVRNGFKSGNNKSSDFYVGHDYNNYFALLGTDMISVNNESYNFHAGIAGGFNINDILSNTKLYDISSFGYNMSLYSSFVNKYLFFTFTSMLSHNIYDNLRYVVQDNRVSSKGGATEILNSIQLGTKFTLLDNTERDNKFLNLIRASSLVVRPELFYNNGYITIHEMSEENGSAFRIPKHTTFINDFGAGALIYTTYYDISVGDNFLQGAYIPYINIKGFYREYSIPEKTINFVGMGKNYDINTTGNNFDFLTIKGSIGTNYEKDSHILGISYSYEYGIDNYSDHQFLLNYKISLQ